MTRIGPFPGMDPWLESRWSGMHHLLISMIQKQLNPRLRPMGLLARIEERVYVESLDEPGGFRSPDVAGIRRLTKPVNQPADSAVAISDEPYVVRIVDDPVTLGHVEIVAVADQAKVITAIEVLSPTNKIDPRARREYLRKRDEYRAARVSIVEIDLIRDGMPLSLGTLDLIPPERRTTCSVWVHRGWKPGLELEYYAVPLRSRLPTIRVPLRPADTEVVLPCRLVSTRRTSREATTRRTMIARRARRFHLTTPRGRRNGSRLGKRESRTRRSELFDRGRYDENHRVAHRAVIVRLPAPLACEAASGDAQ